MHQHKLRARPFLLAITWVAVLSSCVGSAASPRGAGNSPASATMEPGACPVTVPGEPLLPPPPYLAAPPAYYQSVWYGTPDLWTMLHPEGETWSSLPRQSNGAFSQKTWWWSGKFIIADERQPLIAVTGRRLDAPGFTFTAGNPGTHAYADFGTAMLVGIDIPTAGCWEIQAEYKGVVLSYVVAVRPH